MIIIPTVPMANTIASTTTAQSALLLTKLRVWKHRFSLGPKVRPGLCFNRCPRVNFESLMKQLRQVFFRARENYNHSGECQTSRSCQTASRRKEAKQTGLR